MFKTIALQVIACSTLAVATLHAQIATPAPSPAATVMQTVGLTDFTIAYSRPGVKGRDIFGEGAGFLVPFGELWRTGANRATTIEFDRDITVADAELAAGKYAILTRPGAEAWEVMFYTETDFGGVPADFSKDKVAATVSAPAVQMPEKMESFAILFDELTNDGANLYLLWDKTAVVIPVAVGTDAEATASIEAALAGPTANDYYAAASYYYDSDKDLEQALAWIQKANELNGDAPKFWQVRRQALIEAKLGRTDAAIASAKRSLALAREAGNMDYVRMNEADIAEWSM